MVTKMGEFVPYSKRNLERLVRKERDVGNIIILAGGSFDQYHDGHVYFLRECKRIGEQYLEGKLGKNIEDLNEEAILIVNVGNDGRVRLKKGEGKPIFEERARARIVSSIDAVDYTTVHPYVNESPTFALAKIVRPDIIVTGSDDGGTFNKRIKRREIRDELGYKVRFDEVPRVGDTSSSSILNSLIRLGPEIVKRHTA